MTYAQLVVLLALTAHSGSEDARSVLLSIVANVKYECTQAGCSPSSMVSVSSLKGCQMACLANSQCRTSTFGLSNHQCEMFADIPSQYGSLSSHINFVTMVAIDERQLFARTYVFILLGLNLWVRSPFTLILTVSTVSLQSTRNVPSAANHSN